MPEIHLRQPGLTYSACGSKNKERIQKFKETGDSWYIYQNELGKACYQHDIAYEDFKDLPTRTASGNVLRVMHLMLQKSQNMMDIKELLL